MISSDRDIALDYVLALCRNEIEPFDEINASTSVDADELTQDDVLTDSLHIEQEPADAEV